jgi:hypothetical protein
MNGTVKRTGGGAAVYASAFRGEVGPTRQLLRMAEVANGGHVTVRIAVGAGHLN